MGHPRPGGSSLPTMSALEISAMYDGCAEAWLRGPDAAYRRFADALVNAVPLKVAGASLLDVGAGTGAVSAHLIAAGARVIAVDSSPDMLRVAQRNLPGLNIVVADAMKLPFRDDEFDGALSGFCINHVPEPDRFLAGCARVVRPGGCVLASTFARGADHPAKACVEAAARARGWVPPAWDDDFRAHSALTDTVGGLDQMAERGGLTGITVREVSVDTGISTAADLVNWRLGMAQLSGWVSILSPQIRGELVAEAQAAIAPLSQPLRRSILILSSIVPA